MQNTGLFPGVSVFSKTQVRILQACAVVIVVGSLILAVDRFVIRGDEPSIEARRDAVVDDLGLEVIRDPDELARLQRMLVAFEPLMGEVTRIDAVLRQTQPAAFLWLVEFRSRHYQAALDRAVSRTGVDAPRFLILVELPEDPGWPAFLQLDPADMPQSLPVDWHPRLASLQPYRLGIHAGHVAFVSQLEGPALVQALGVADRPEFHPGLLGSALRVEVQQALDIVGAMPGAPALQRFYQLDDVEVKLPAVDTSALQRMAAQRQALQQELEAQRAQMREQQAQARAALRRQQEENMARFRARNEAAAARLRTPPDDGVHEAAGDTRSLPGGASETPR